MLTELYAGTFKIYYIYVLKTSRHIIGRIINFFQCFFFFPRIEFFLDHRTFREIKVTLLLKFLSYCRSHHYHNAYYHYHTVNACCRNKNSLPTLARALPVPVRIQPGYVNSQTKYWHTCFWFFLSHSVYFNSLPTHLLHQVLPCFQCTNPSVISPCVALVSTLFYPILHLELICDITEIISSLR